MIIHLSLYKLFLHACNLNLWYLLHYDAIELFFFRKWYFIKLFPFIHVLNRINTFLNNKIDLLISLLENLNVFWNLFYNSSSILFKYFLLQDKHLYFIKVSLTLSYSRKQWQSLHLILWISSVRLSTGFDNEVDINLALEMNFIL